jgi:hypothetical protein
VSPMPWLVIAVVAFFVFANSYSYWAVWHDDYSYHYERRHSGWIAIAALIVLLVSCSQMQRAATPTALTHQPEEIR